MRASIPTRRVMGIFLRNSTLGDQAAGENYDQFSAKDLDGSSHAAVLDLAFDRRAPGSDSVQP